jgi:hypothetical protein
MFPRDVTSPEDGDVVIPRQTSPESGAGRIGSFDMITIMLVIASVVVPTILVFALSVFDTPFSPGESIIIVLISAVSIVVTTISVREQKRSRESSVAPTLFIGTNGDDVGIVNVGNGPAHRLSVEKTEDGTGPSRVKEVENSVIRVGDLLPVDTDTSPTDLDEFLCLEFEYRSNVGYKSYSSSRRVEASVLRETLSTRDDRRQSGPRAAQVEQSYAWVGDPV